jgi:hypothetical protein
MGTDPRRPAFRVAIVESRDLSGTCPKPGLVAAGDALHEIEPVRVRAESKPIIEAKPRAMLKRIDPRNARFRVLRTQRRQAPTNQEQFTPPQ